MAAAGRPSTRLPLCDARVNGAVTQYAFGDLRSRCGRHNGAVDTEDQDGDFQLDSVVGVKTHEDFVRFVFPIGSDQYYVRDGGMVAVPANQGGGAAGWRLYRIPFRSDTLAQGVAQPAPSADDPHRRSWRPRRVSRRSAAAPGVLRARSRPAGRRHLAQACRHAHPRDRRGGRHHRRRGDRVHREHREPRSWLHLAPGGAGSGQQGGAPTCRSGPPRSTNARCDCWPAGLQKGEHAEAFNRFTTEGDKNFLQLPRAPGVGPGPGAGVGGRRSGVLHQGGEGREQLLHVSRPGPDQLLGT